MVLVIEPYRFSGPGADAIQAALAIQAQWQSAGTVIAARVGSPGVEAGAGSRTEDGRGTEDGSGTPGSPEAEACDATGAGDPSLQAIFAVAV